MEKMKKILPINGSHRGPKGHTAFLLEKLSRGAVSAGAEFETMRYEEGAV
jgi:multimeric flavodoxin WrbA